MKIPPPSLPGVLNSYFEAINARRINEASGCFSKEAMVHDEKEDHIGIDSIRRWIENTWQQYDFNAEPLSHRPDGETHTVTCKVSGNFPGSPIELDYVFILQDDLVRSLKIE